MIAKKEYNSEKKVSRYTFYLTEEESLFSPTGKNNKDTLERLFQSSEDVEPGKDPFGAAKEKKKNVKVPSAKKRDLQSKKRQEKLWWSTPPLIPISLCI